jgi:hypothetical protein
MRRTRKAKTALSLGLEDNFDNGCVIREQIEDFGIEPTAALRHWRERQGKSDGSN